MIKIEGWTYPVRNKLRELGAKWNADEKAWFIDEEKLEEANAIVAAAGKKPPREIQGEFGEPSERRTKRNLVRCRCPTCGTEFDQPIN